MAVVAYISETMTDVRCSSSSIMDPLPGDPDVCYLREYSPVKASSCPTAAAKDFDLGSLSAAGQHILLRDAIALENILL